MRIHRHLALAAIVLATSAAFAGNTAGEASPTPAQTFTSMIERSQVRAAAADANEHGLIANGDAVVVAQPVFMASKTRAEVIAETITALKRGLVASGDAAMGEGATAGRS